jgi:hypothetical protein
MEATGPWFPKIAEEFPHRPTYGGEYDDREGEDKTSEKASFRENGPQDPTAKENR